VLGTTYRRKSSNVLFMSLLITMYIISFKIYSHFLLGVDDFSAFLYCKNFLQLDHSSLIQTYNTGLIFSINPPESDSYRKDLCFTADVYFFLFQCEIFEMRRPIGAKFCTVISTRPNFIMAVQNFVGAFSPKNSRGQNLAKFGLISGNF